MKVCSLCANTENGKRVESAVKHSSLFVETKSLINDKRVHLVHYPKSKMLMCDWCGEKRQNLWRDDDVGTFNKEQGVQERDTTTDATSNAARNPTNHPSIESSSIEREAVELLEWLTGQQRMPFKTPDGHYKWFGLASGTKPMTSTDLYQLFLQSKNIDK